MIALAVLMSSSQYEHGGVGLVKVVEKSRSHLCVASIDSVLSVFSTWCGSLRKEASLLACKTPL